MRSLLLAAMLSCSLFTASAQIASTPYDDASPAEYAQHLINIYAEKLGLDATQKQQAYDAILYKRRTLDSFKTNNVSVPTPMLWALTRSVDTKFREILTPGQYARYEDMPQVIIAHVPYSKLNSASTHK